MSRLKFFLLSFVAGAWIGVAVVVGMASLAGVELRRGLPLAVTVLLCAPAMLAGGGAGLCAATWVLPPPRR